MTCVEKKSVAKIDHCTNCERVQWIRTPSVANQEILQRPLMQQEIRKMLREESHVHFRSNEILIVMNLPTILQFGLVQSPF